jgi:cysteine desulfurase / selenocysteine lyase
MKFSQDDFPIFKRSINGKPLIYLDNASTTQKPHAVLAAIHNFYTQHYANIHRGIYTLAEEATTLYENVRISVATFLHARDPQEIVFTHGTTESINLIATAWAAAHLQEGDTIVVTAMEHHANLLPWQHLAQHYKCILNYIPVQPDGTLDLEQLDALLTPRTKLVSVTHVSHVLGTRNDIFRIIKQAHAAGARVLIDAAQSAPHLSINVQELDVDFLVFSGHKLLGPTGVGVLYIRQELHDHMQPYQRGGGMVFDANYTGARFLPVPYRLEAGTPPSAAVIGLGAALDYVRHVDVNQLQDHEATLCNQLIEGLTAIPGIQVLGPQEQLRRQGSIVSFTVNGMHAHDVAAYLDSYGICVRAGHHCAQPFIRSLGIDACVRVSFYGYNTHEEVHYLLEALRSLRPF